MNTQPLVAYISFAVVLGAAVAIEHLAFRTPRWRERELARRAIGDTTVLVLFFVLVVLTGNGDSRTWLGIVGGYAIAACVKLVFQWSDDTRKQALMGKVRDDVESAD